MRTTRTSGYGFDAIPDSLREFLSRRAAEIAGLALLALCAALALALVTWSVQDPSINHATAGRIHNALGWPGAVSADLLMQVFGLASIAMLAPPAVSGWRLIANRRLGRVRLRLLLWIVGSIAAAAVASALPATARWPLPTGLGGVVGDIVLGLFGSPNGPLRALLALGYALLAILCLSASTGLGIDTSNPAERSDDGESPRHRFEELEDEDRAGEPGFGIVSLGALIHAALSLKAAVTRRSTQRRQDKGFGRSRGLLPRLRTAIAGLIPKGEPDPLDAFQPTRRTSGQSGPGRTASAHSATGQAATGHPAASQAAPAHAAPRRAMQAGRDAGPHALEPDEPDHEFLDDADDEPAEAVPAPRITARAPAPPSDRRTLRDIAPPGEDDDYELPPLTLLAEPRIASTPTVSTDALEQNARLLEGVLDDFGVRGEIINIRPGPVVTLYELEPAPGIKSSRVIGLADDIARSMSAISARVAVIPGRNAIGIELPNQRRETVYLRELLASDDFDASHFKLALCLGKTIGGEPVIAELARMPHLLVAGTTGSGKSVAINTMILSLVYRLRPEQCRLIMVDPKMLELSVYDGIPHLLTPVVTDPKKAVVALKWAVREMEERYKKMSKLGVRNIDGFNARVAEAKAREEVITRTVQTGFDRETGEAIYENEEMDIDQLPYIVVIVDEMADLMMVAGKDIEGAIQRLAQMARAAGIHVILATQRPSVDVITGTIKANFPTRISFQVTSKIDSRTILGEMGAEQLLGQGDMLHMAGGGRITRVHGPFVSDDEVEKIVAHLKSQGRPNYLDAVTQDEPDAPDEEDAADGAVFDKGDFGAPSGDLYDQAIQVVLRDKKASTSYIQRRLQIGYNRAASLMERMEKEGIVGAPNHAGKREILVESADRGDVPFDED
jgi:DNA segregation ATPase FtsK/SpoIIIE, S-DNA-T family